MRTGTHGTAQTGKTALLTGDLVQVVAHLPQRLLATRDRALALVAYTEACVARSWPRLKFGIRLLTPDATASIRRSKGDQEGLNAAPSVSPINRRVKTNNLIGVESNC